MNGATRTDSKTRDRLPPYSNDAEQAVLGAMLLDSMAIGRAIEILRDAKRFYHPAHRKIFVAITWLFEKPASADITTVADELEKRGELESTGGRSYLVELAAGVATSANIAFHAQIVLEKSTIRELIASSTEIIDACYRQESDIDDLLDSAEHRIFSISEDRLRTDFTNIGSLLPHTFEEIEEYRDRKGGLAGYPTGFSAIDDLTAGMHPGNLIIVAARPSMGKSALVTNIAENFCIDTDRAAAIFSLEMSKEQLALRMLCGRAKISAHLLRTNRLPEVDWPRLSRAAGPLSNANIYIDDTAAMTVLEMRAKARRLASQTNLGLVIVDYLQMMSGLRHAENRQQEISQISRGLKALAKDLGVPVIACSQLSRQVEQREDKRPQLADLRESGAIEQDADIVMFIYRDEYYKRQPEDEKGQPRAFDVHRELAGEVAEIKIAKQRNGPTGTIKLSFLRDFARFESYSERTDIPISNSPDSPF